MTNNNISTQDDLIELLAHRAKFTKGDVKIILDCLIEIFEEAVARGTSLTIKRFGKLVFQQLESRDVKGYTTKEGEYFPPKTLPPTERITFKLAENIRKQKSHREG